MSVKLLLPAVAVVALTAVAVVDAAKHSGAGKGGLRNTYDWVSNYEVQDRSSDCDAFVLPQLEKGGRVIDLVNGEHFDDLLRDTPDEMRPPSVILFHGSERCPSALADFNFKSNAESRLPARVRLLAAKYDMDSAPTRAWYKFTPERDLEERFGVTACPALAMVPRTCSGWTDWGVFPNGTVGSPDFVEQCTGVEFWDGNGDWVDWVNDIVYLPENEPSISPTFGTYAKQNGWLTSRESITTTSHIRSLYMSPTVPAYSDLGYKIMDIPKELLDWMLTFHKAQRERHLVTETWYQSATQINFHEVQHKLVSLDHDAYMRDKMMNKYLRPILEEWAGCKLELTAFFGIREYYPGAWLRNHVDRHDTHVISATMSLGRMRTGEMGDEIDPDFEGDSWPLEGVDHNGRNIRYEHPPGKMVLYESAKFIHGRPYPNPDQVHVGAFVHFKPADPAYNWQSIAKNTDQYVAASAKHVPFRAAKVVEPVKAVFTDFPYAQEAKAASKPAAPMKKGVATIDGAVDVIFQNHGKKPLRLYWEGFADEEPVLQCGDLRPGKGCDIGTWVGTKFFWTEAGLASTDYTSLPGSHLKIKRGIAVYSYDGRDHKHTKHDEL